MAKLITHHDKFHIHKILGLLVLLHYLYRFGLLFRHGTAFPSSESPLVASLGVLLHGLLSWSSLLLPLPSKRNFNAPMIWPEFRLHSITFATRHVVATICTLNDWWPDEGSYLRHGLARAAVVLGAVKAASLITDRYGCRDQRTTNSMPYPSSVSDDQRPAIKKNYALAQFAATAVCLLPDATINFAPLLAIQMAPLLMTLVRKGKVKAGTYHRVYAISLWLGYVMVFVRLLAGEGRGVAKVVGLKSIFMLCFPSSKLRRHVSAMAVWAVNVALSAGVFPLLLADVLDSTVSLDLARIFFWFVTIQATVRQAMVYAPLFGMTRLRVSMSVGHGGKGKHTTLGEGIGVEKKAE
jgi:hypothetical protein